MAFFHFSFANRFFGVFMYKNKEQYFLELAESLKICANDSKQVLMMSFWACMQKLKCKLLFSQNSSFFGVLKFFKPTKYNLNYYVYNYYFFPIFHKRIKSYVIPISGSIIVPKYTFSDIITSQYVICQWIRAQLLCANNINKVK